MPSPSDPAIRFDRVRYAAPDGRGILSELSFEVGNGEILVLLGRSGCGKTTTLKLVNLLLSPASGEILVLKKPVQDWDPITLRRNVGYVIQDTGLFPHYRVADNVALVPSLLNWPETKIKNRVFELLKLTGLPREFLARFPHELSGGQRQRVGLARALAADPPLLLMDEPFAALDPITCAELRTELKTLQRSLEKTILFVTHDLSTALELGDRIALMEDGNFQFEGTPGDFMSSQIPCVIRYRESLPRYGNPEASRRGMS